MVPPAHLFDEERQDRMRADAVKQGLQRPGDERRLQRLAAADWTVDERAADFAPLQHTLPVQPVHRRHQRRIGRARKFRLEIADSHFTATPPQRVEHAQLERAEERRQAGRLRAERHSPRRIAHVGGEVRGPRLERGGTEGRGPGTGDRGLESRMDLRPMLATLAEAPLTQKGLVYEPKYDGIRALVEMIPAAKGVTARIW